MLSRSFVASYAVVLRPPHAARTFGMALVGRFSYGVVFLAYGAFRWRASGRTRLVALASGIGLSVALAGQSPASTSS
jgi:hypothetical protein